MGLIWHGPKAVKAINREMRKRIKDSAQFWVRYARERMGVAGHNVSRQGTGTHAGNSKPGQHPRKQTGHLRRNVTWEMEIRKPLARVGTNVKYGRYLEEGTHNMSPRPWMTLTNRDTRTSIKRIIETGTPL